MSKCSSINHNEENLEIWEMSRLIWGSVRMKVLFKEADNLQVISKYECLIMKIFFKNIINVVSEEDVTKYTSFDDTNCDVLSFKSIVINFSLLCTILKEYNQLSKEPLYHKQRAQSIAICALFYQMFWKTKINNRSRQTQITQYLIFKKIKLASSTRSKHF